MSSDQSDYLTSLQQYGDRVELLWAPEPKLAALPLGGAGVVLAELMFAPTWFRMRAAFEAGDLDGARREQLWKLQVASVFGKYGGSAAERAVYTRLAGYEAGPPRLPQYPMDYSRLPALEAELQALGFFNQTWPASA